MITVIGEALVDLVDQVGAAIDSEGGVPRPFVAYPGGSPLNVAVGVARLDHPAGFCGRVGRDAFGRLIRAHAVGNGVDVTGLIDASQPSTLAVVSIDDQHKAVYDFYVDGTADWQWQPAELAALPTGTSVLHTASLASWTAPGDAVIAARVTAARAEGLLTTYDPNVRPALMPAGGTAKVERLVGRSHLVKASDDDLAFLYPGVDVADIAIRWLGLGAGLVVITRGPGGADAFSTNGHVHREGLAVDVVDTVGAGDAFMSGLLVGLTDRGAADPAGLETFIRDADAVAGLLGYAVVIAAITCEREGADPPTAAEVAAWRGGVGVSGV